MSRADLWRGSCARASSCEQLTKTGSLAQHSTPWSSEARALASPGNQRQDRRACLVVRAADDDRQHGPAQHIVVDHRRQAGDGHQDRHAVQVVRIVHHLEHLHGTPPSPPARTLMHPGACLPSCAGSVAPRAPARTPWRQCWPCPPACPDTAPSAPVHCGLRPGVLRRLATTLIACALGTAPSAPSRLRRTSPWGRPPGAHQVHTRPVGPNPLRQLHAAAHGCLSDAGHAVLWLEAT